MTMSDFDRSPPDSLRVRTDSTEQTRAFAAALAPVARAGDRLALCLHGFPELGYSWRHQLPVLAELGYRAWAPDVRGYGATRPRP